MKEQGMSQWHADVVPARPLVVERDGLLAALSDITDQARRGSGRLVLLSGEAGVGKTTLVRSLLDDVPTGVTVRHGACDNMTTAAPLGPFVEAAPELRDIPGPVNGEDSAVLLRAAAEVLTSRPSLVVLEDMHWADGASLDLVRYLGRRIDRLGLALVVTFRSDELDAEHPLRIVLGDLATSAGAVRMTVPPLTPAGVEQLARAAGSALAARDLHARTGGNPFYVTEVLATGDDDVPGSVRDAVLARVSRLGGGARRVLGAAAVLGPGADAGLVAAVAGRPFADVDECIAHGVLRPDGAGVSFRHELARRAVEDTLTIAARTELHAGVLTELRRRGSTDDRRLAHHALGCGDRDAVLRHATRAAAAASARGAHREAAEHYRTVLDLQPAALPGRADVLDRLGFELYVTGRVEDALQVQYDALEAHRDAEDAIGVGRASRWISRLTWMLGRGAISEQFAHRAVEALESEGPGHELAMAYSNLAQMRMLSEDVEGARAWGDRALAIARDLDDRFVRAHALNNVGAAIATGEQLDAGTEMIRESLGIALDQGFVDHAGRAYCNLSVSLAVHRHYAEAERIMAAGITYAADRDLDYYGDYITAMLARSAAERGAFDEAGTLVDRLLAIPHLAVVGRIPALTTRGLIDVIRGGDARGPLDEAQELTAATRNQQILVPVALARAESAWIGGRLDDVVAELATYWDANAEQPHEWRTGELAWWLMLAGDRRELPGPAAPPFAHMLEGRMAEAAAWWDASGSPLWAARALVMSDDSEDARRGAAALDALGAFGVRDAAIRDRQRRGLPVIRGPRATSAAHPAGLTVREAEVLRLLADGLTNAEIGRTLFVSTKTAGHHVSAVLRKLEAPTRARAVAVARARGLLDGDPPTGA